MLFIRLEVVSNTDKLDRKFLAFGKIDPCIVTDWCALKPHSPVSYTSTIYRQTESNIFRDDTRSGQTRQLSLNVHHKKNVLKHKECSKNYLMNLHSCSGNHSVPLYPQR